MMVALGLALPYLLFLREIFIQELQGSSWAMALSAGFSSENLLVFSTVSHPEHRGPQRD